MNSFTIFWKHCCGRFVALVGFVRPLFVVEACPEIRYLRDGVREAGDDVVQEVSTVARSDPIEVTVACSRACSSALLCL